MWRVPHRLIGLAVAVVVAGCATAGASGATCGELGDDPKLIAKLGDDIYFNETNIDELPANDCDAACKRELRRSFRRGIRRECRGADEGHKPKDAVLEPYRD